MAEKLSGADVRTHSDLRHDLTLPNGNRVSIARANRVRHDGLVERTPRMAHASTEEDQHKKLEGSMIPVRVASDLQVLAAMEMRLADLGIVGNTQLLNALPNSFPVLMDHEGGTLIARRLMEAE